MFAGFAQVWTPVVLARHLKAAPLPVTVAGEKLVLFRSGSSVGALIDRCPHRGVALSLGKVTPDGCLQCPFHAWEFEPSGQVRHVPLNPEAKKDRLAAGAVAARELGGLIWVYTALGEAPDEPRPPEGLVRPDLQRTWLQLDWKCHWTRAMENMLDSPHVPYLHRTTIGRAQQKYLRRDSTMELTWEPNEHGGRSQMKLDGRDNLASLDFYRPNVMSLSIPIPGKFFRIHAICVPVGPQQTRMIIVGARDFLAFRVLNPIFNRLNRIIAEQDRAVVESSDPIEVPPPAAERSVETDRVTLQFRKYYAEQLRVTSAPARS